MRWKNTMRLAFAAILGLGVAALTTCSALADQPTSEPPAGRVGPDRAEYRRVVDKAIEYLTTEGLSEDGSYSRQAGPGVTALVTTALLRNGRAPDDPAVAKSLKYLEGFVQNDGGIYQQGSFHRNYETCLAIMCLAEANRDRRYDKTIDRAEKFVKQIQWSADEGHDLSSMSYGGAGYGKHKRPDLSNTNFLMDALKSAGAGPDDPAMQAALVFVSRCQNLESQHNTSPHSAKNPDGGFYYTVAAGGSSQAGETETGGLRSYGSMTYAGLKSMIYAGVKPDDQRVQAAVKWISRNYTLEQNPNMGAAGLYYYYHTFAKCLDALGHPLLADEKGEKHDWRRELFTHLAARQQPNGSWVNQNDRWFEGDPNLVTGYALLALSYCRSDAKGNR